MSKRSTRHAGPMRPLAGPSWRFVLLTWKAILAAVAIHAGSAVAQSYPAKAIRIVVAFPPAGGDDTVARLVGPKMADALKQAVVIENRPGAGGNLGADLVARAAPDGYTILVTGENLAINRALYRKLPFDAAKDFARVSQLVVYPLLVVAGPNVPAASIGELMAMAKSRPGVLNYGHPGVGTQPHLAMELLKLSTGIDIVPIPYKGSALTQIALTAGEVAVVITGIANAVQWVKSGRARALGVGSVRRSAVLPDVPTVAEAGVPGFEFDTWYGLFAPAKTPRPILNRLSKEVSRILALPDVKERFAVRGAVPKPSSPEQFDRFVSAEVQKLGKVVRAAGVKAQ